MENNRVINLEKRIKELKNLMRFKRQCLIIALENNLYRMQTLLYGEINKLRAELHEIKIEYNALVKGMKVVTFDDFKKEVNKNFRCRH